MSKKALSKIRISKKVLRQIHEMSSHVDYDGAGDGIRTRDTLLGRQELFR